MEDIKFNNTGLSSTPLMGACIIIASLHSVYPAHENFRQKIWGLTFWKPS